MRKTLVILCILASCLIAVTELEGKVIGIIDGDSIKILCSRTEYEIRLEGVDCPEMGQPFGKSAKKFTSKMAFGKVVTVRVKELDKYGRTVGTVLLPDGTNLCRELIAAGLGWWFWRFSDDASLGELEAAARQAKRGLWALDNPQPPWEKRQEDE